MVAFYNQGDQNIYKDFQYVPQEKYRLGFTAPTTTPTAAPVSGGITNTNAFTNSGGNNSYSGPMGELMSNANRINQESYYNSLPTPNVDGLDQSMRDKTFMGMRSYNENQDVNPVDAGEYLAAGQDIPTNFSPTIAGRVQNTLGKSKDLIGKGIAAVSGFGPISYALGKMDRFDTLPAMDREYINQKKYYTGPTVFGENNSGLGKDPYGINVRSAFGNYGAYVDKMAAGYEDITDEEFEKLSNFQKTKIGFYRKEKAKRAQDLKIAQSDAAAANDRVTNPDFEREAAKGNKGADFTGGRFDGAKDKASYDKDPTSFSGSSKDGGLIGYGGKSGTPVYQQYLNGGRVGYFFGGRIGLSDGGNGYGFSPNDLFLLKKNNYDPSEVSTWSDSGRDLLKSLKTIGGLKNGGLASIL